MRAWLTYDIYWKAFSVLMALGIWLTVHKFSEEGEPTPGMLFVDNTYSNVPVTVVSSAADARRASIAPNTVTVAVRGSPDAMAGFDAGQLHAFVDLTGIDAAHGMISPVDVATPPRVTLLSIDPPTVTVSLPK